MILVRDNETISKIINKSTKMENKVLDYFNGDELAASTWKNKYAAPGEETPEDTHKRLAHEFAKIEDKYHWEKDQDSNLKLSSYGYSREHLTEDKIMELFRNYKYVIPGGSVMSGAGTDGLVSLSNCLRGDTKVLTRDGFIPIRSLSGKEVEVLTGDGEWILSPFKSYGEQELVKLTLERGKSDRKEIYCTEDHKWFIHSHKTSTRKVVKTIDLKVGNKLSNQFGKSYKSIKPSPFGIAHGIVFGDGHTVKGENFCNNLTLCGKKRVLGEYFRKCFVSSDDSLCEGGSDYYSFIPNSFRNYPNIRENKSYLLGWLAGYFATDGCIDNNGSMMINSSKEEDLKFVQDICGVLGIYCGEIKAQERISNLTNEKSTIYKVYLSSKFFDEDFFILDYQKKRFKQSNDNPSRWTVVGIEKTGLVETVYCAEVPTESHSFVIEGNILTHNCFVIGAPSDSYADIMQTRAEQAQLMKRRGGVGYDLSELRPRGASVKNAARSSTGAASFMDVCSDVTNEVAQNGRRGALMLSMNINHPDIEEFITKKQDLTKVTGANISVKVTDEFMEAMEKEKDYLLRFPVTYNTKDLNLDNYNIGELVEINDPKYSRVYVKKVNAAELWKLLMHCAWNTAEPRRG